MPRFRMLIFLGVGITLLACSQGLRAQSFASTGNLDCNGFSKIQKSVRPRLTCADFRDPDGGRGYDNGHYVGHDEPSIGFISTLPRSGNNVQWDFTLTRDRPLPVKQTFELFPAVWFAMALCDPNSVPNGACIPDSDENTPFLAGSAFMELQFYPPGFPPFINQISCDLTHWCAALNIDSFEVGSSGVNPNCTEPVNFAFLQTNGVPAGPPSPANATVATFTPNRHTLLMNPGDHLRITLKDTMAGLLTRVEDLTTGQGGFMVASGANGFQNTDPNSCAGTNFDFHPEFDTAKFGNFVPWAALQANVNFSMEIGHFEKQDNDSDDGPCFPGPTVAGCVGADVDFDGTSYQFDWPDGTRNNATSIEIGSFRGGGIGPLSASEDGNYNQPYPIVQFETDVAASEAACQPSGVGCTALPAGAQFYPFYALAKDGGNFDNDGGCTLLFGNFRGFGVNNFGGDRQYGTPNLPWFFGTISAGPQANPCMPQTGQD